MGYFLNQWPIRAGHTKGGKMRKINTAGLSLIKLHEGYSLTAYQDGNGVWTIGYGHTPAEEGQTITADEAEAFLLKDLEHAEVSVGHQIEVPLSDNEFSALVCLVFNIGAGNFHDSSVKKVLNEGRHYEAANWFLPWCKIAGVESDGLMARRQEERALFLKPDADLPA